MPIQFTCPHCGTATDVADQYGGQSGPCVSCGKMVAIPLPDRGSPFAGGAAPPRLPRGGAGAIIAIVAVVADSRGVGRGGHPDRPVAAGRASGPRSGAADACTNNLKQIGLAMHNYHQVYGCFPPAFIPDKNGKPMHSWRVLILPYLEGQGIYSQYRFDEPWDSPHNAALAQYMPLVYYCPSEPGPRGTQTSYAMLVGPHCISDGPTAHRLQDITGGPSNTIMVAECNGAGINWMEPRDIDTQTMVNFAGSGRAPPGGPAAPRESTVAIPASPTSCSATARCKPSTRPSTRRFSTP